MQRTLAAILVVLASTAAAQDYGTAYDYQTGNVYQWSANPYSGTTLNGTNLYTGRNWSTQIRPNGNMGGLDGGGNYWTYDRGTGAYQNFGTGRTCFGTGAARTCY